MTEFNINIMFLIVVAAAGIKAVSGYKRGMVKQIISFVSLVVLSIVAAFLAYGITGYHDGKVFNVIVSVLVLSLLGVAHHLVGVVFFSAKILVKLPVVHFLDKLLGIVFGVFEIVLILWTVYAFIMMMDTGTAGDLILSYTEESSVLLWIYRNNYLARLIEDFLAEFSFIPIL